MTEAQQAEEAGRYREAADLGCPIRPGGTGGEGSRTARPETAGGHVDLYDEMTNEDVMDPAEIREYEQSGEARLDAEDEARWAVEAAAAEAAHHEDGDEFDGLADGEER
jgi:hypothetical protein